MKAISVLLKNLPLAKIKRDKVSAQERDELNKREFVKYFHFLSKYLAKSQAKVTSSAQKIREYTIIGLGNLLESNINYGLEQFMKMTYIEDQAMISVFLAVLTKIVKQGIQLDQSDENEPKEKYDRLMNMLMDDHKLRLIFLMLQAVSMAEQDELCKSFVKLFADRGEVLRLQLTTKLNRHYLQVHYLEQIVLQVRCCLLSVSSMEEDTCKIYLFFSDRGCK